MKNVSIKTEYIELQQLLKMENYISSGGQAKYFLLENKVFVNGEEENRRGRKLRVGDIILIDKEEYKIVKENTTTNLTSALLNKLPNLKDNLHLLDSWTPVTYNSYFNTYYGSYMGFVFKKKGSIKKLSSKIKNIKNMRYVTYWQTYMGGLPIAARLGEAVVKHL